MSTNLVILVPAWAKKISSYGTKPKLHNIKSNERHIKKYKLYCNPYAMSSLVFFWQLIYESRQNNKISQ